MYSRIDLENKISVLEDKLKRYEELLKKNNIDILNDNELNKESYVVSLREHYFTILEKPNGEIYTKITNHKPESYMHLSSKQFDYLGELKTPFYSNGMYNQYNHKVIEQYIQYSFYLND